MKKITLFFVFLFAIVTVSAQETPKPNYRQAAKYSPKNLAKMVHSTSVSPHWLKKGNRFWYAYKTSEGSNHYIVDVDKKTKKPLFDNVKMAKWLTEITKDPYDAKHLPRFNFKFNEAENAIRFRVTSTEEVEVIDEDKKEEKKDSTSTKKARKKKPKMEKKTYHLEYKLGSNGLTIIDTKKPEKKPWQRWANIAPDSSIVLYGKNHNIYWMDKVNFKKFIKDEKDTTVVENQWTTDGEENYGYTWGGRGQDNEDVEKNKDKRKGVWGTWSHDSKKFVFEKSDSRHIKDLWVINSTGKKRPTLETYKYHMPGEQEYYKSQLMIFDIPTKTHITVPLDSTRQQSLNVFRAPRKQSQRDDEFTPSLLLSKKGKLYFSVISRDRKKYDINVADLNTGEYKTLIEERFNTYIESRPLVLFNNETEMLHWAERDGWAHFYLYDADGNLKNQITEGDYHVDGFAGLDEKSRTLFFTANGVNKEQDPYYLHTYKINLNGSGMRTLDPGNFTKRTSMSDSNQYFVSNYSRVNTVPKSEVRDSNGRKVMDLETADLSQLFASGYKFPEPFKVKADDGITDIYGVMYKPFDMDTTKVYPLLEYVYPGPQTEAVNKSFSYRMDRLDRMAQVGFVVITLGNRGGHPDRSKWYHNYGYGNLRDYGLADKKYVAQQLANRHDYIDIEKVGIYGHSGGGFMSTAAMLVYPDFFKAAVSSAGNHDNNVYNSWWSETHHGVKEEIDEKGKVSHKYKIDDNQSLAKNLKGHLMLIHGDMDNNVHPAGTIRMANELIKAKKRFKFMIMPGQRHGFGRMTEYSFWLRADHFSKYLLGEENTDADFMYMNMDEPKNR
ncbi:S9 family peptidase [Polaribacter dokdonensis]|uniref:Dipeptidyl aminopeptidase/acylaminoacyl peptidase n=1 Tax=Polaribacter dokdonensis DSW-5 TaxID=1300348 RepID=A0A0M9CGP3_9FLAO|nr:DPP IV N-terminal domain-containing protein [Polaribacter dokdonensis]KOY52056.1 Dipeptidyl peptidase IV [Polaribacter dokdonensis DSW-5]SED96728.1 Dipeptidyl aminopeptidase/acylaminoacyl peptidase [Polaribacter dokdonensis DSW-5]